MGNKKSSKAYHVLVKCQFCGKMVESKELADHAKNIHTNNTNRVNKPIFNGTPLLDGVEIQNCNIAGGLNQLLIDESGVLISPQLIQEEQRKSREERLGTVPLPKYIKPRRFNKSRKLKREKQPSEKAEKQEKSIDDIYREKNEWLNKVVQQDKVSSAVDKISKAIEASTKSTQRELVPCPVCNSPVKPTRLWKHFASAHTYIKLTNEQIYHLERGNVNNIQVEKLKGRKKVKLTIKHNRDRHPSLSSASFDEEKNRVNLVKCPLCNHKTEYSVLFVHIQVSHPEVNPKIVMSKFNKTFKHNNSGEKARSEAELDELVKNYERLKQDQDESRDGGKYMGNMRRENGKFGSLPLYDDYSDEADAE